MRNGLDGGLMVYRVQAEGLTPAKLIDAERQIWEELFASHGHRVTFIGHASDKHGVRTGFTFLRERDGESYYDTTLIVREPLITYGVRVYTRVGDMAVASDLQIARSFVVNA
jgi:hypothetical protein